MKIQNCTALWVSVLCDKLREWVMALDSFLCLDAADWVTFRTSGPWKTCATNPWRFSVGISGIGKPREACWPQFLAEKCLQMSVMVLNVYRYYCVSIVECGLLRLWEFEKVHFLIETFSVGKIILHCHWNWSLMLSRECRVCLSVRCLWRVL